MEKKTHTLWNAGRNPQIQSRTDAETSRRANDIFLELGKLHLAGNLRKKKVASKSKTLGNEERNKRPRLR